MSASQNKDGSGQSLPVLRRRPSLGFTLPLEVPFVPWYVDGVREVRKRGSAETKWTGTGSIPERKFPSKKSLQFIRPIVVNK